MDRDKRIDELLATLTLGTSDKLEVRKIIAALLDENDDEWEKAVDSRIGEIEKDRGHE
jgi:hypothetical protein